MRSFKTVALALAAAGRVVDAAASANLTISAVTSGEIESDGTTTYYSRSNPLLITNDGGASTGGFHAFEVNDASPLNATVSQFTGRTKLVTTVYDIAGKDYFVSIPQTTSVFSFYELPSFDKIDDVSYTALGDWSSLCPWRSPTGNTYLYLFGKGEGVQYLVRSVKGAVELVEIQTFDVPAEMTGCAASDLHHQMYLIPHHGSGVYSFKLQESTQAPDITVFGSAEDELTGIAIYKTKNQEYIFAAQTDVIDVYSHDWKVVGKIDVTGLEDLEIQGLSMHQATTKKYPKGFLAFAAEGDDFSGFALSSLNTVLSKLNIKPNTDYNPRSSKPCGRNPIQKACSYRGFLSESRRSKKHCDCFAGSSGSRCEKNVCVDNCSGHGKCVGPNTCECKKGWGGLHCSFLLVEPKYETEANGPDGDDPAIWISPKSPELSRIITTTKSDDGAGLGVFDLSGKQLQMLSSSQPNNVDMIYGFQAGDRVVDLAFAACRGDDTLCIFEMTEDGVLKNISGGIQPSDVEDALYGSCVYHSKKTGKQYLFVNEKSARYMQYELTSTANGTLETTLVREFVGGSGGQVEGCVSDEDNGWLILGEEPSALWRYDAEPDGDDEGYKIAFVGDGHLKGDVEGVTLVPGSTKDEGFIIVSSQGVSAYNVYRRASPHEWVVTFTITDSADGKIDHVSNTDGLAAVGNNLGPLFPHGLIVTHDDTNELPEGGADPDASFKLVALEDVLDAPALKSLKLLDQVDPNWDPRA